MDDLNVSGSNLPGGSVVSEVEEHGGEPVVNLIQRALFVRRLQDRLRTQTHKTVTDEQFVAHKQTLKFGL